MNLQEIARHRFSCRKYKAQPIEKDKLEYVLNAGRIAPSAKNQQPWRFYVVQDEAILEQIKSCYRRDWINHLGTIIVAVGDHRKAWRRADGKGHADVDLAIAIDHMTLAATEQSLATCWICMFDAMKCAQILKLEEGQEAIALLPIGYPETETNPDRHLKLRKPLDEIITWL